MGEFKQLKFRDFLEFLFMFFNVNPCQFNFQLFLRFFYRKIWFIGVLFEINFLLMNKGEVKLPKGFLVGDDFAK